MPGGFVAVGVAVIAVLLVGYFGQKHLPPPKPSFIGLDLGTTFSCVGAYHPVSGNVTIFLTDQGSQCIPSVVAVLPEDGNVVVGHHAVRIAPDIPSANVIYDAKRFIGRNFQNVSQQEFNNIQARYPFKIVLNSSRVQFEVTLQNGTVVLFSPERIGAYILAYLRETATSSLGREVSRAVISVPAEFDQSQRNATRLAAVMAGLDIWRVIQEPTAAAMAYGLHEVDGIQMVLVVDLGGGTLDVSLLNRQGGLFITAAIAGNSYLGGQDFTHRLLQHIMVKSNLVTAELKAPEIPNSNQVKLPQTPKPEKASVTEVDQTIVQSLRLIAEQVKINLTSSKSVHVQITSPVSVDLVITQSEFNQMNEDLFKKVLRPIELVLEEASIIKDEVDEIVMVGGSTRVPRVREVIGEFFGRDLSHQPKVDPELAVATGVSVQAGIMGGMWPLQVSAIEIPMKVRKIHVL